MNILQHKNIIKPPLLPVFISSVIQFDKFFHQVVLYENYLLCIFMNINEILEMIEKNMGNYSEQWVNQTLIEHIGHFIMGVNLSNRTTKCKKILSSKIKVLWVFEISCFPWQPIMPTVKNGVIRTKNTHILTTSHPRLLNMVPN